MAKSPDEKLIRFSEDEARRLIQFYTDAEREILNDINQALLRENKTEYLNAMKTNVQAILKDLREGSRTWCEEAIPRVYTEGAKAADVQMKAMGTEVKVGFAAIHQQAAQVLAETAYNRFDDVATTIGRRVDDIYRTLALENIKGSVVGYKSWQQVAKNFREQLAEQGITGFKDRKGRQWNMRTYAETVARTTTMEAHLQGTANRLLEHGHDLVKVSTHIGACEKCRPWEGKILSLSGKTEGYPTLQEAKDAGLFHPRCFPAGVLVSGPPPLAVFSRWYDGELIILHTASGIELPVTPNHPILTPKGWVAAGQLVEGDYVIRQLGEQGMIQGTDPHKDQIPSRIEDVVRSFGQSKGMSAISVPVSPEDFHGDGKGSDVCVIYADGLLGNNINASFHKPTSKDLFSSTAKFAAGLDALSMVYLIFKRLFCAANSVMSSFSQRLPFFGGHSGKTRAHCNRPIRSGINTKIFKTALNRGLIHAKTFSDSLLGFPCRVSSVDVGVVEWYPAIDASFLEIPNLNSVLLQDGFNRSFTDMQSGSELIEGLSGSITPDEIIGVQLRSFSGHVYNLQTTDGWYACNSIITHNCKHAYGLYIDLENGQNDGETNGQENSSFDQAVKRQFKEISTMQPEVYNVLKEAYGIKDAALTLSQDTQEHISVGHPELSGDIPDIVNDIMRNAAFVQRNKRNDTVRVIAFNDELDKPIQEYSAGKYVVMVLRLQPQHPVNFVKALYPRSKIRKSDLLWSKKD